MNYHRQSELFQFQDGPFSKNVQSIGENFSEVTIQLKILTEKLHVKKRNIKYYDLYYTVIKNKLEKQLEDDENVIDIYDFLLDYREQKNEISDRSFQAFFPI